MALLSVVSYDLYDMFTFEQFTFTWCQVLKVKGNVV